MIVSWMAFLVVASAVVSMAALLVDGGLEKWGAPTRFAWLAALALAPAVLIGKAWALLRPEAPPALPAWVPVLELPPLVWGPQAAGPAFGVEQGAALLWILSALGMLLLVGHAHLALRRERAGWERTHVLGQDVYVSADRGPAVAGVWRPWIVLPRWAFALPEEELRMVLLHEGEHVRARDTRLLGAALALVTISAWNPFTWWQLRRLRAAMELDCDRRVLRRAPDRACYGASLLSVAARASGPSLGLAAFTERSLNLKRRILAMTARTSRWTAVGGGVLVLSGLVVGLQACGVEAPTGPLPANGPRPAVPSEVGPQAIGGDPVFTPFTVAPRIVNREDVVAAMLREYPPLLRDAGVQGEARVYMHIDEQGVVTAVRLDQSSGHPALDDAAIRVAGVYRFEPARNRDKPVAAWVSFPVAFRVAEGEAALRHPSVEARTSAAPPSEQVAPPTVEGGPTFTPFTVAPSILNREEVVRALASEYPEALRAAGVAGTARLYFFIDDEGQVKEVRLDRSSGNEALDQAALRVARVYRFTPALNRDKKVPVWVSFPITFQVR